MATAATHKGCCQVCGHEQKLPGELLSKHGYTVRWGFFSGTCPGSRHLPFEVSTDLIDGAIASALSQADDLEKQAADLQRPAIEPMATCRVYRTSQHCQYGEKPGYVWVKGKIEPRSPWHGMRFVVITDNGREFYVHAAGYNDTERDVATHNNRQYAESLLKRAAQMRDYAAWQEDRIKDWKPQPLRPIDE